MEHLLSYSSVDFVQDDDFVNWVNHGRHHVLIDRRWRNWIDEHPDKVYEIEEARVLVLTLSLEPPIVASRLLRDEVWDRIQETLRENDEPIDQPSLISRWYSKLAIAIGVVAVLFFYSQRKPVPVVNTALAEVEAASSSTILVRATRTSHTLVLSDGTSIVLMPGSTLEYPRNFSDTHRDVYLSGEAYFEVSDESNHPFVVKTSHLTLAALGTSFSVRGYGSEDDTRIQVKSGRTSVTQNDAAFTSSIVLLANHQATYLHRDKSMHRSLVDDPGILVPVAQANFVFRETPLKTVLESIENAYGIDISFNEIKFADCALDADLNALPLYGKLKRICDKLACSYQIIDDRIEMHGGNCGEDIAQQIQDM